MNLDSLVERTYGKETQPVRRAEREAVPPIDAAGHEAVPPISTADRPSGIRPTQMVKPVEGCAASVHEAFQGVMSGQPRNQR